MSEQKRRCWAECLGDCKGPLTLEHVASSCIFEGDTIPSRGIRWAKEGFVHQKSQMGAKILCKHHNETTSHLDQCAGDLSKALRTYWRSRRDVVLTLKGEDFERWSLKLATNMLVSKWFLEDKATPPKYLVEFVFGRGSLDPHAGLHMVVSFKHRCTPNNFGFMLLGDLKPGIFEFSGFLFNFQSLVFAFFPHCGKHKEFINSLGNVEGFELGKANVVRHPVELGFERRQKNKPFTRPQKFKLKLEWPGKDGATSDPSDS